MSDGMKGIAYDPTLSIELAKVMREDAKERELAKLESSVKSGEAAQEVNGAESTKVKEAAEDFEAMLLQQMFKSMWQTVPGGSLLTGSREEEIYRDMLNQQLSKEIASKQSIGIKDVIMREMNKDNKR